MSKQIYAAVLESHPEYGTVSSPVIDFRHWDAEIWPEDAEERFNRGEDVDMIPNPHYIPNAGMQLAEGNAATLFQALHLDLEEGGTRFALDVVYAAVMRLINGDPDRAARPASTTRGSGGATIYDGGVSGDRLAIYAARLLAILVEGRARNATHLVAC